MHDRILLSFGSGIQSTSKKDTSNTIQIYLDPVIEYTILDWWVPLYPYNHKIQDLLNTDL